MVKLVFARHGESEWNKANLFTGWADVDLSEKGTQQAIDAGKLIKEAGIEFDQAYTSVLKRAIKTPLAGIGTFAKKHTTLLVFDIAGDAHQPQDPALSEVHMTKQCPQHLRKWVIRSLRDVGQ